MRTAASVFPPDSWPKRLVHRDRGLKEPIGKQDQYAAAFGGLNFFCFKPGGAVTVEPQRLTNGALKTFFDHFLMFWTGHQRESSSVLTEQKPNTPKNDSLLRMREHAEQLQRLLGNGACDQCVRPNPG